MTIDEAIEKYKRIAGEHTFVHDIDGCLEVVQLVEWLRTARGAEKAGRYFTRDIRELKQKLEDSERENAKLQNVQNNAELLRAMWNQERAEKQGHMAENAKLREACVDLLQMAESHDPEWPHWPEMHEYLRELGVDAK